MLLLADIKLSDTNTKEWDGEDQKTKIKESEV